MNENLGMRNIFGKLTGDTEEPIATSERSNGKYNQEAQDSLE